MASTDSLPAKPTIAHHAPTNDDHYDPTSTNPFSPFYDHARASESSRRLHHNDLEKGTKVTITAHANKSSQTLGPDNKQPSLLCRCSAKRTRGCWRNMSKKQRVAVQILIALVFMGAVTGLGVGVSKAMGTGIWKGEDGASAGIGKD
ncbi:MAG: hypothetical protein LQ338_001560 [Usnochroma carphineum]|nr:MAG: hypothetical protein LQ338_001560 [Usnochroma carphineum]